MLLSWGFVLRHRRYYLLFCVVMAALNIVLVRNLGADTTAIKNQVESIFGADNTAVTTAGTYMLLMGKNTGSDSAAAVYQYILVVTGSLAIIWSLRQFMSDNPPAKLRVRDSFYEGLYPLAQFILVFIVLVLELLPLVIGSALFGMVISGGIAVTVWEQLIWLTIFLGLSALSIWLLVRSLFAIYIVTLPAMTPIEALRQANKISKGNRLSIVRKSLFLGVALTSLSLILVVPAILFVTPAAQYVLFAFGILSLPLTHAYLYTFYRQVVE